MILQTPHYQFSVFIEESVLDKRVHQIRIGTRRSFPAPVLRFLVYQDAHPAHPQAVLEDVEYFTTLTSQAEEREWRRILTELLQGATTAIMHYYQTDHLILMDRLFLPTQPIGHPVPITTCLPFAQASSEHEKQFILYNKNTKLSVAKFLHRPWAETAAWLERPTVEYPLILLGSFHQKNEANYSHKKKESNNGPEDH